MMFDYSESVPRSTSTSRGTIARFSSKSQEIWADERELRWLLHLLSDDELYVPFGDSLAGIVVTPDFPPEYRRAIANYADAHLIEIGELRWSNFSPEMVPSTLACVRAARA